MVAGSQGESTNIHLEGATGHTPLAQTVLAPQLKCQLWISCEHFSWHFYLQIHHRDWSLHSKRQRFNFKGLTSARLLRQKVMPLINQPGKRPLPPSKPVTIPADPGMRCVRAERSGGCLHWQTLTRQTLLYLLQGKNLRVLYREGSTATLTLHAVTLIPQCLLQLSQPSLTP